MFHLKTYMKDYHAESKTDRPLFMKELMAKSIFYPTIRL